MCCKSINKNVNCKFDKKILKFVRNKKICVVLFLLVENEMKIFYGKNYAKHCLGHFKSQII